VLRDWLSFGVYGIFGLASVGFGGYMINNDNDTIKNFVPFVEAEKLQAAAGQLTTYTGSAPAEVLAGVEAVVKDSAGKNPKFSSEYAFVEGYIDDMLSHGLSEIKDPFFYQSEFKATAGLLDNIAAHSTDKERAEKDLNRDILFTGGIGLSYVALAAVGIYYFRKNKQKLEDAKLAAGIQE
jgi:hypothetical protein